MPEVRCQEELANKRSFGSSTGHAAEMAVLNLKCIYAAWQQQIGVFHTYSEWHITFYAAQSEVNNNSYQTIGDMVLIMATSST